MAVCTWCDREMRSAASCTVEVLHRRGERIRMVAWGRERGWRASARCGDCGVKPGGFHHPGCDIQQCPACRRQMLSCGCRYDEDGLVEDGLVEDGLVEGGEMWLDSSGRPTQRMWLGDQEVIVHYDDVPDSDLTVVDGVPCTTALRTVIDIAPDIDAEHLETILRDSLERELFTVQEAWARLAEPDMADRPGAGILRRLLSQRGR